MSLLIPWRTRDRAHAVLLLESLMAQPSQKEHPSTVVITTSVRVERQRCFLWICSLVEMVLWWDDASKAYWSGFDKSLLSIRKKTTTLSLLHNHWVMFSNGARTNKTRYLTVCLHWAWVTRHNETKDNKTHYYQWCCLHYAPQNPDSKLMAILFRM